MRPVLLALGLLAPAVLADIGPRPPPCVVPSECVTCTYRIGADDDGACAAEATAKGLVRSECSDRRGPTVSTYYCPAGSTAVSGGWLMLAAIVAGLAALGGGAFWWRRRAKQ